MPTITTPNTGIELFYESHGDPANETMFLVMGLGAQLTLWPDEFVAALVAHGYHVIRYDNRDIGLSQKMEGARAPGIKWQVLRKMIGWPAPGPYTLSDMADDGIGLMDALGIERAHVVGASMGGMIAQLMAVSHGERLLSLTGLTPEVLRNNLTDRPVMAAVLEFLANHEPDLVLAADALNVTPAALIAAHENLSG